MRLALVLLLLIVIAGCDSGPDGDIDIGEFRGTLAGTQASGPVLHTVKEARAQTASTFDIRIELRTHDELGSQQTILTLRLPFDGSVDAADFDVPSAVSAELVRYEVGVPVSRETAATGTAGLFRPENQDQDWFRIHGVVDLTFSSGTVVGHFKAVPQGPAPELPPGTVY